MRGRLQGRRLSGANSAVIPYRPQGEMETGRGATIGEDQEQLNGDSCWPSLWKGRQRGAGASRRRPLVADNVGSWVSKLCPEGARVRGRLVRGQSQLVAAGFGVDATVRGVKLDNAGDGW